MSKKNKKHRTVFIVLISLSILLTSSYSVVKYNSNDPENYFLDKYEFNGDELKFIGYTPKILKNNYSTTPVPFVDFYYTFEKWKFNYNGRTFNIYNIDGTYYDDYQLEDMSNWCTEYIKKNIDSNVVGVEIENTYMFQERNRTDYVQTRVFTKNDVIEFLNTRCEYISLLYYTDKYDELKSSNIEQDRINYSIDVKKRLKPVFVENGIDDNRVVVFFVKNKNVNLKRFYSFYNDDDRIIGVMYSVNKFRKI